MKTLILKLLYYLGVYRLFAYLNRRRIPVLMLHQIMDDDGHQPYRPLRSFMGSETLDRCMSEVNRMYNFVSLDEAVDMMTGRAPLKPYSVALTFDDGYRNNLSKALPVLARQSIPFTVYLTAGLIDRREPMWVDRLDYAIQRYQGEPLYCEVGGEGFEIGGHTDQEKCESFTRFRRGAKRVDCDDLEFLSAINAAAEKLESAGECSLSKVWESDEWTALLSWQDILEDNSGLVTYGSHTVNHVRLARTNEKVARDELMQSKSMIEERLGKECRHFAYPDGSYNDAVSELVRECGYKSAVVSEEGLNIVGDNVFQIKRLAVPLDGDELDLLARITGLLPLLSRIKRVLGLEPAPD